MTSAPVAVKRPCCPKTRTQADSRGCIVALSRAIRPRCQHINLAAARESVSMRDDSPLRLVLLSLAGWVHREQAATIAYLVEENRVKRGRRVD